jgi:hypothetical protein
MRSNFYRELKARYAFDWEMVFAVSLCAVLLVAVVAIYWPQPINMCLIPN